VPTIGDVTKALGRERAKLREIETIISTTDLLELLMLLCSIIVQQHTLQCTIHRDSSAVCYSTAAFRPTSQLRCGHKVVKGKQIKQLKALLSIKWFAS